MAALTAPGAVLERDGVRIDLTYDIWAEGEMSMEARDAPKIIDEIPANLIAEGATL